MNWKPISEAPKDGTEILGRDEDGNKSLIAWCADPSAASYESPPRDEPGWYRRAEGDWDLFDSFALQLVEPVEWLEIPLQATAKP